MRPQSDLSAFILAGGKSTRMGTDKAFVMFDGKTLLDRALDVATKVTRDVYIVGDAAKFASFAPIIEDIFPGCGPLGGIHAALRSTHTNLNLILAVDLPFVSQGLLQLLIARAKSVPTATVTVARSSTGWQPLCAVYRQEFADIADKSLRAGSYKIDALFNATRTEAVAEQDLQTAGSSLEVFRNLNTPEELAEAERTQAAGRQ